MRFNSDRAKNFLCPLVFLIVYLTPKRLWLGLELCSLPSDLCGRENNFFNELHKIAASYDVAEEYTRRVIRLCKQGNTLS